MSVAAGDAAAMTTRARAKAQQSHGMPLSQACTISPSALTPIDFDPDMPPQSFYLSTNNSSEGLLDMLQPLHAPLRVPSTAPQDPHAPLLHPDDMLW